MNLIIIASAILVVASAGTIPEVIPILKQVAEVNFDGTYHQGYETGNGITAEEHGVVKNLDGKNVASEVAGSVSYTSPEGIPIVLKYLANEFGFQVQGDHLPQPPVDNNTPPPIPPQILRSLEWNAAHPYKEEKP
ncbi:hypothetical protein JTB14_009946 [Gonioctena quinquepunctata]|nr:hypothetical protein JTB14_009946 [Gonioctena quinquepunctata]